MKQNWIFPLAAIMFLITIQAALAPGGPAINLVYPANAGTFNAIDENFTFQVDPQNQANYTCDLNIDGVEVDDRQFYPGPHIGFLNHSFGTPADYLSFPENYSATISWDINCTYYVDTPVGTFGSSTWTATMPESPVTPPNVTTFDGATTDFSTGSDNVTNPVLEKTTYGKIVWVGSNLNFSANDFDTHITMGDGWINVESSQLSSDVNSSAEVSFYGGYSFPEILIDGQPCATCEFVSSNDTSAVFNVSHFSNYTVINGTNITVCGDLTIANTTYLVQNNITLSANTYCFGIDAYNVTLDCQGYTIDGNSYSSGRAVEDVGNQWYGEVRNCVFKNFPSGDYGAVSIDVAKEWRIHNNTFESSCFRSINLDTGGNNYWTPHWIHDNYIAGTVQFQDIDSDNVLYFYNNIFNETDYVLRAFSNLASVKWNTTETVSTNIWGGPNTGGNYWANPAGTGNSETCNDADTDGFCDATYTVPNEVTDYLPLATPGQCTTPAYACVSFGNCTPSDVLPCTAVNDTACGLPFNGTLSTYDGVCDYCTPDWVCNGYGDCNVTTQSQPCNSVLDLNLCGEAYNGTYTEFPEQDCYAPGGYEAQDLPSIIIDFLGRFGVFLISMVAIVALIYLWVWARKRLKNKKQ